MPDRIVPTAPKGGPAALTAVLDDVLATGAALAAADAARTRALAAAGHLALDVMADQRATARAAELALREVASEIAAAENLSDRTVQTHIQRAMTLVDHYPHTLAAWEAGALTRAHVYAIVDIGTPLPADARTEFDLLAVATAQTLSPGRLRTRLAMLAERLHPTTITERHHRGRDTRCVRIVTGHDGMSDLIATLPTVLAVGIYDRLTQQSRAIIDTRTGVAALADTPRDTAPATHTAAHPAAATATAISHITPAAPRPTPNTSETPRDAAPQAPQALTDERTTAQLRADILTDLLLTAAPTADPTRTDDGPGTLGTIRARVQVIVPALTMLTPAHENTDPAELVGHGPLDAATARTLAEATTLPWDRVITHPPPEPSSTPTPTTAPPPSTATCAHATATAASPAAPPPPPAATSTTPTTTPSAAPPPSPTSPTSANATTPKSTSPAGTSHNSPAESSNGPAPPAAPTPTNPSPTPPPHASSPTTHPHPTPNKAHHPSDAATRQSHRRSTSPRRKTASTMKRTRCMARIATHGALAHQPRHLWRTGPGAHSRSAVQRTRARTRPPSTHSRTRASTYPTHSRTHTTPHPTDSRTQGTGIARARSRCGHSKRQKPLRRRHPTQTTAND